MKYLKIISLVSILLLTFFVGSCRQIGKKMPNTPLSDFKDTMATATPDFRKGWYDGCEVGLSTGANTFYKTLYKSNQIDGYKMTESPEYKAAWGTSFWYCYRYTFIKQKSPFWKSFFEGYK